MIHIENNSKNYVSNFRNLLLSLGQNFGPVWHRPLQFLHNIFPIHFLNPYNF
jgi:hypothetical protein